MPSLKNLPVHLVLLVIAMTWDGVVFAEQSKKPGANSEPIPKGYDESFQSGDIPKPNTPEMDPDNVSEDEVGPDRAPDMNPMNDPNLDLESQMFRVGASAALTLPHMLNFAVESLILKSFSVSLNYGNVTRSLNNIDIALRHQDLRFRWFPYQSSFFLGLALGQHQLTGELDRNVKETTTSQAISAHGKMVATANYVAPHVGWFSVWDSGFIVGFDLGYLIPASPKSTFTSSFKNAPAGTEATLMETDDYKKMKKDLEDSAKTQASKRLPFASLLRLGWMF